jgi:radical SAM protein with 4Fe4S-binding SPASM domain
MGNPIMARMISRSLDLHLPLNVHFDLTYRCNERCVHCYLDHDDLGELTTVEVKGILDQLRQSGTFFLTYSGGEIFLRKDCFELIGYARQLHFDVSLKTNGLTITADTAERLRSLGVRRVQVSIYSADAAIHDAITKVRGSLQRSLQAVRLLRDAGLVVKIACPLMPQNTAGYRKVVELAHELGVPYTLDVTITGKIDGDLSLLKLREPAQNLLAVLSDPELKPEELCEVSKAEPPAPSEADEALRDIACSAGHNACYISPYGDVFPCVQMPLPTGNLRQERFADIWYSSPALRRLRALRDTQVPICSECSIRKYCERCPGLAMMEDGDLYGPSLRACDLAEAKARLAGAENPVSEFRRRRAEDRESGKTNFPLVPAQRLVNIQPLVTGSPAAAP